MTKRDRPLLAVLIDADNESAKLLDLIVEEINGIGELGLRRIYADWTDTNNLGWSEQAKKLGFVLRQATAHNKHKNATDIELIIDAMDALRDGSFDGFVLVSGDSDFTALGNRLREDGKIVIGIGKKDSAAESFVNICNRYIFLENIEKPKPTNNKPTKPKQEIDLNHAYQRISNAMRRMESDGDWYNLSEVKKAIMAAHSDFDERSYGHTKFSSLVSALNKKIKMETKGNSVLIREI